MAAKLASFNRPPVVEVVMGVQFQTLRSLLSPHTGLFWERIRDKYPVCRETVNLAEQIEDFTKPSRPQIINIEGTQFPRLLFEDPDGEWLVQLQRDRFLHNWRLVSQRTYPRYEVVKPAFFAEWERFQAFVRDSDLGEIKPNQFEITYLNHIAMNDGESIGDVFPDFRWCNKGKTISSPESTSISCTFVDSDAKKRLRTSIRPARHKSLGDIIVFELTVRGFDQDIPLDRWFDEGRQWIVTSFAELTSPEWQSRWERIE